MGGESFFLNRTVTLTAWDGIQKNPTEVVARLGEKNYKITAVDNLDFFKQKKN